MTACAFGYCTIILLGGFVLYCYHLDIVTQLLFFRRVSYIIRLDRRFDKHVERWIRA